MPDYLADLAARVRALATPHRSTVVLIDGPAGAGKTTLAAQLQRELDAHVVHMDDAYAGWEQDLDALAVVVAAMVAPLRRREPGSYRRFDWVRYTFAETVPVPAVAVVIVEGVASAGGDVAGYADLIVWVETADEVRLARGLARDGEAEAGHWHDWMRREAAHFARARTRARADVTIVT